MDFNTRLDNHARMTTATASPAATERPNSRQGEQPTLEVRNLHRFFKRLKAVNDVSFKAYAGQVMGFIGPNGAGKTTTMRILATLDLPTAGDAFICGQSVIDDPEKVRRMLGFMPDSFGRYPNTTVVEYLDFFARAYGFKGARRRETVEHVLVFTELRKLADKYITELSKGMGQRLCLGRTLIHDPQVLVLDEPAAGLDPRARVELRELIKLLATEMKKTVLISSHILTELGEICDSAAIIEAGNILAYGTIEEIQNQEKQIAELQSQSTRLMVRVIDRADELQKFLLEQPYVGSVAVAGLMVSFDYPSDEKQQHELLKEMIQRGFFVVEYRGKSRTLEDAFMSITKGVVQ
ncbi:MAG: ABC transporter ATP-binding protein [Planctomycetota bacterium]|nr:ABC transporter ATP-binding protein [Planctomycetota bacterium]MDA1211535.1 ABC transporter ATP-binding protein [Planctomycetota bacterium]